MIQRTPTFGGCATCAMRTTFSWDWPDPTVRQLRSSKSSPSLLNTPGLNVIRAQNLDHQRPRQVEPDSWGMMSAWGAKTAIRIGTGGRSMVVPSFEVPPEVTHFWKTRYARGGKILHRPELLNYSDYEIVMTYSMEFQGLCELLYDGL